MCGQTGRMEGGNIFGLLVFLSKYSRAIFKKSGRFEVKETPP